MSETSRRRVATLDVGTNTLLLLVAERDDRDQIRVLADRARIVRLGEGVDASGHLSPAAIERALAVLREYAGEIRALAATPVAVGTQALREVDNGLDFLRPAREILGCDVEVVTGSREAELSWRAVRESFPALGDAIVMDVGGGSTEFIVARGGALESKVSLPIGAVRLTERFIRHDPPTSDEIAQITTEIDRHLDRLNASLDGAKADPESSHGQGAREGQRRDVSVRNDALRVRRRSEVRGLGGGRSEASSSPQGQSSLVGIAGTVTTLAALHEAVAPYDPDRVHGMILSRSAVGLELARLCSLPLDARKMLPGLDAARADVIIAGALIVARAMDATGARELRVSDRGVRWGLLYEALAI